MELKLATPLETTNGLTNEMDMMVMVGCWDLITMEKTIRK